MKINYGQCANNSLQSFVLCVRSALKANHYDLLLAGGDSGNIMVWITQQVYKHLSQPAPKVVVLPTYRHVDEAETILFDNRVLSKFINPADVRDIKKVLIVDDEVGEGNTLRGILTSLSEVSTERPAVTFVAENEDFDAASVPGWTIDFRVPQMRVEGVFNAISYIIPGEFEAPIKRVLASSLVDLNDKQVMAALLDLPLKVWNDGAPEFTMRYRDLCAAELDNFHGLQAGFQAFMSSQIGKLF